MIKIVYPLVIIIGLLIGSKANFFDVTVEDVKATPVKTVMPTISFQPKTSFKLNLDLENGTAKVESNYKVTSTEVEVNHPVKEVVKKVYVKVPVKKEVEVRDTLIQKIPVMFALHNENFKQIKPNLPDRFE